MGKCQVSPSFPSSVGGVINKWFPVPKDLKGGHQVSYFTQKTQETILQCKNCYDFIFKSAIVTLNIGVTTI